MSDAQLSVELMRFIQTALPSYDAAVVLVFLSRAPDRAWTVDTLVDAMGLHQEAVPDVRRLVDDFTRAGVLEHVAEDAFRLVAVEHPAREIVEELRMAYDRRPVTLIRAIDLVSRAKIQSFADSFRLKRDRG
jgi:hypothetical protein